jgi:hypothetical protein
LESNNEHCVVEEPDYDFAQLLSDLGGVIGLYMGIAVASLIELFETCALFVFVGWQTFKNRLKVEKCTRCKAVALIK